MVVRRRQSAVARLGRLTVFDLDKALTGRSDHAFLEKVLHKLLLNADGVTGLWDERDSFFHDVLCVANGETMPLRVRSIVRLIALLAVLVLEPKWMHGLPAVAKRTGWFLKNRPDLASLISDTTKANQGETWLLTLLRGHCMKALPARMLDEAEFLSD